MPSALATWPTPSAATTSQLMDAMMPHYRDEQRFMSMAKAGREELEEQFQRDREKFESEHPDSWR